MIRRALVLATAGLLAASVLAACPDSTPGTPSDPLDATMDAVPADTGGEVSIDVAPDVPGDVGSDPGMDVGSDPGLDAGSDTGVDAGTDPGLDPGSDTAVDAGSDPGLDAGSDAGVDAGSDTAVDTGTDSGVVADTGPDSADAGLPDTIVDAAPDIPVLPDVPDLPDVGPDAGPDVAADTWQPPPQLNSELWGRRLYGNIIEVSRTDRLLWVGTRGNAMPPELVTVRGGLARLDLDTGEVKLFEAELPKYEYDVNSVPTLGPIPSGGVVEDGARHLAVVIDGLLVIEGDAVTHVPITTPGGASVVPINLGITNAEGQHRGWLSTSAGLLLLDLDTFAVQAEYTALALGVDGTVGRVAVDPATGTAYAAHYPGDGSPSSVKRVDLAGAITTYTPGDQDTPTGLVGEIVWSAQDNTAFIALGAWNPYEGGVVSWDGTTASTVVIEGQLTLAAEGEVAAFGAQTLALDDVSHVLMVGGRIQANPIGPSKGGGLAFVDLDTPNHVAAIHPADVPFVAIHITSAAYDPQTRRAYIAVAGQCDETHLRRHGLYALSFPDPAEGQPIRLERPILSGLRTLGELATERLLGMRDDNPGLACQDYPIQKGLAMLRSNRAAEVMLMGPLGGPLTPQPGVTDMSILDDDHLAVASWKDQVVFGAPASLVGVNQATSYKVSLQLESVAWSAPETLWIGGRTSHHPGDPPSMADTGPHGAARLTLDATGAVAAFTHFVANSALPADVKGLPSNDIRQVLPAPDGSTYVACAKERVTISVFDRVEDELFLLNGLPRPGGVARVLPGDTIDIVADSTVAPDARVIALDDQGDLVIGDAEVGLVKVSGGVASSFDPGMTPPVGSIPHALWLGKEDDLAVGYDTGLMVRMSGAEAFIDGVGFVWEIQAQGLTLLVATDEGLLRVWPDPVTPPTHPDPGVGLAPPFAEFLPPEDPGGECLPLGALCGADPDGCCPGLTCVWSFVQSCQ